MNNFHSIRFDLHYIAVRLRLRSRDNLYVIKHACSIFSPSRNYLSYDVKKSVMMYQYDQRKNQIETKHYYSLHYERKGRDWIKIESSFVILENGFLI